MSTEWRALRRAWQQPGTNGANLRLEHFPACHMMTLANLAKASMSRVCLEPAGLSVPEWRILTVIQGAGSVAFAQVAQATQMDKGQLSRTLRAAQGKGLLSTALTPLDHRSADIAGSSIGRVVVHITPAGQKLHDDVLPAAQLAQLRLVELMSPAERRTLADVARRFEQHLTTQLQALP